MKLLISPQGQWVSDASPSINGLGGKWTHTDHKRVHMEHGILCIFGCPMKDILYYAFTRNERAFDFSVFYDVPVRRDITRGRKWKKHKYIQYIIQQKNNTKMQYNKEKMYDLYFIGINP